MTVTQGNGPKQGREQRATAEGGRASGWLCPPRGARFPFTPQEPRGGQVPSMAFPSEGPGAQRAATPQVLVVHWAVSHTGVHSQRGQSKPSPSQAPPRRVLPEAGPRQALGGRFSPQCPVSSATSWVVTPGLLLGSTADERHPLLHTSPLVHWGRCAEPPVEGRGAPRAQHGHRHRGR